MTRADRFLMAVHRREPRWPWQRRAQIEAEPLLVADAGVGRVQLVVAGESYEVDATELVAAVREAA